jgi:hypothetical protein
MLLGSGGMTSSCTLGWRVEKSWNVAVSRVGDRIRLGFDAAGIACTIIGTIRCNEPAAGERGRA